LPALIEALAEGSERMRLLRQSSPFAGAFSEDERLAALAEVPLESA